MNNINHNLLNHENTKRNIRNFSRENLKIKNKTLTEPKISPINHKIINYLNIEAIFSPLIYLTNESAKPQINTAKDLRFESLDRK